MKFDLNKVTWWLLIIGGLNWGLEALGSGLGYWFPMSVTRLVYLAVGLSALYQLFGKKRM